MANPTNKGVGTGSAALYDYSVLNTATDKFFKGLGDNIDKKKLEKAKSDAKQKKINDQLAGKLGDYDPTKLRVADQDKAFGMYQGVKNKWNGRYGEISKDPQLANEYAEDMAKVKTFMGNSANSVKGFADQFVAINLVDSGFSKEKKKEAVAYFESEGATVDEAKKLGFWTRDMVTGDTLGKMDAAFANKGDVLYKMSQGSGPNALGQIVSHDIKTWLPDAEAIPKFKATITPEIMQDMDIMYPGLTYDEQVVKFYDKFKESRETKKRDFDAGKVPDAKDGGGGNGYGFGNDKFNFGSATIDLKNYSKDKKEIIRKKLLVDIAAINKKNLSKSDKKIAISKMKKEMADNAKAYTKVITTSKDGSTLPPITIKGVTGVVSEFGKRADGRWVMVRAVTKDENGVDITSRGDTQTDYIDKTLAAHLESTYNIGDLDEFHTYIGSRKNKQTKEVSYESK